MGSCSSVPAVLRVSVVLRQRVCLGIVPYLHLVLDHPYACKPYLAAAAAKSLQSCPTLCDPRDGSPPGSPVPRILQARTLEWVAISFSSA